MTWYYLFRIQEIYLFFIINARRWSLLLEPPNRRCVVRWVRARSNATYSQLLTNCSLPMVEVMIPVRWWRFFSFCSRPVVFNSIDDNFSNCLYSWCYTYINICIWIALSLSLSLVARTSRVHAGRWCMNGSRLVRSYLYHANCLCVFFKQSIKMHVTQYFISCLNWNEQSHMLFSSLRFVFFPHISSTHSFKTLHCFFPLNWRCSACYQSLISRSNILQRPACQGPGDETSLFTYVKDFLFINPVFMEFQLWRTRKKKQQANDRNELHWNSRLYNF